MKLTIVLISLFMVAVHGQDRDYVTCIQEETCDVKKGKLQYWSCMSLMADVDLEFAGEKFNEYFDEYFGQNLGPTGRDFPEMIDEGCENPDLLGEATYYFVGERMKYVKDESNLDNEMKWIKTQECLYKMAEQCRFMKSVG